MKTLKKIYQLVGLLALGVAFNSANASVGACSDITGVVFCNGDPTYTGAVELAGPILFADDFSADGRTTLTDGHFHTLEIADNQGAWSGQVTYVIYDDAAGLPGNPLAFGQATGADVVKTSLGTPPPLVGSGLEEFTYGFDLIDPLKLAKGNYWFALFLDSPFVNWVSSDGTFGSNYVEGPTTGLGPWSRGTYNLTFALTGFTPEPGPLMLMLIGAAGILASRKLRQQQDS